MSHVILGTAGHIDHGKTALVQALTGIDTDRLKEEKERGLTIDLGFAHFGDKATIIDVPGHEKFIRNMVAGVSTIDLVLFVIAADDGIMPQTREHLDILNILQVKRGFIIITKTDLVEAEWLELVKDDVLSLTRGSCLQDAPLFEISSVTGKGVPELKRAVSEFIQSYRREKDKGIFWLPVDRSFTVKGFGTVVTGSVLSGTAAVGDTVEILPQKQQVKIRGLQKHSSNVESVASGDRAAINLQAIDKQQVARGDVVAAPNYFTAATRFDAHLRLLPSAPRPLKMRSRVRLHIGTSEIMARISIIMQSRIEPGESAYVQLHLERPAVARRRDPFVVRQYSPTITIGGGMILNSNAPKRKLKDPKTLAELQALEKEEPIEVLESILAASGNQLQTVDHLASEMALPNDTVSNLLRQLQENGAAVFVRKNGKPAATHRACYERLQQTCMEALTTFHQRNPRRPGLPKAELVSLIRPKPDSDLLNFAIMQSKKQEQIRETDGMVALTDHQVRFTPEQDALRKQIDRLLYDSGYTTPPEAEMAGQLSHPVNHIKDMVSTMIGLGEIVRAEQGIYFHPKRVEEARDALLAHLEQNGEITISQFKDLLGGASRKYAMPLINHFDRLGITRREGDVRVLEPD